MLRILILLAIAFLAIQATPTNLEDLAKWEEFKKTHGKKYSTKEEETARYNIFLENSRYIDEHNQQFKAGLHTFDMGINQFSDMTNREFRSLMNGYKGWNAKPSTSIYKPSTSNDLPASVDWRDKGYVTPVKNQDKCGSCWAFSTTGSLEGQHFAKTGNLVSLSEQQLVDCSTKFGNAGCEGGWMDQAFDYIKANKGIDTEESYPYTAYFLQCKFNASTIGATVTGYTDIPSGDESALESAVATIGPISVAIDASRRSFQHYKSGVYYESRCGNTVGDLDHGVLVVGYGATDDGTKYYIVKNSWADTWGDKGYLLMSREKNNNCGIATKASYPLV